MSVPMKKPRTEGVVEILVCGRSTRKFRLPREQANGLLRLIQDFEVVEGLFANDLVPAVEVFKGLHKKYGKAGSILRGLRFKEELTQVQLAEKVGVPQTDISQIENGKRPIGKKMAERLAKVFGIDYRVFL